MVSRSFTVYRVTDIPTAGEAKMALGDNSRRVGLRLHVRSLAADVLLYRGTDPVNVGTGWRLANADGPMVFDGRDSCPRGAVFVGGTGTGAELQILEITQEDLG